PPGDSVCCKSRAPQDHSRFSLCSQTFSLFALSVSHGHPGPSPLTHGCRCSGGQSRAVLQHNPWDLPSLSTTSQSPSSTFLGISPGSSSTLGHSSRSQEMLPKKPRAPPFPLFCQVGLFPWLQGHSLFPALSPGWELGFLGCSWNTPGPISRKPLWGPGPFLGCHWRCCCSGGGNSRRNFSQCLRMGGPSSAGSAHGAVPAGDIGGQMGLFIGASILTILELFDYLYERSSVGMSQQGNLHIPRYLTPTSQEKKKPIKHLEISKKSTQLFPLCVEFHKGGISTSKI
ncbi:hypothetical protein Nmel_018283, partial [Mimus melanotis]